MRSARFSSGLERHSAFQRALGRGLTIAALGAVAWGALSFGAVYPWAYWPLIIVSAAIGLVACVMPTASYRSFRLAAVLTAIAAFVAFQLVPVAASALARWSPARHEFLRRYDVLYALSTTSSHALSIAPHATTLALASFAAFSVLALGLIRVFTQVGAEGFVRSLAAFGLLLSLVAIVQNMAIAAGTGEGQTVYIYGFWPDPYVNKPFGPFINKNNFAGWMIM